MSRIFWIKIYIKNNNSNIQPNINNPNTLPYNLLTLILSTIQSTKKDCSYFFNRVELLIFNLALVYNSGWNRNFH